MNNHIWMRIPIFLSVSNFNFTFFSIISFFERFTSLKGASSSRLSMIIPKISSDSLFAERFRFVQLPKYGIILKNPWLLSWFSFSFSIFIFLWVCLSLLIFTKIPLSFSNISWSVRLKLDRSRIYCFLFVEPILRNSEIDS